MTRFSLRPARQASAACALALPATTKIIDGLGPNGFAFVASAQIGKKASRMQTGYLYHYAFTMLIGLVIIMGTGALYDRQRTDDDALAIFLRCLSCLPLAARVRTAAFNLAAKSDGEYAA